MNTDRNAGTARYSAKLCRAICQQIETGVIPVGELIPSVRALSREHQLAPSTVARALKELVKSGLVLAEPRRGYRVLPPKAVKLSRAAVAYVCDPTQKSPRYKMQLAEFHRAADRRGIPLLAASIAGQSPEQVVAQLRAGQVVGVVFDTPRMDLMQAVVKEGMTAVMVDDWREDVDIDSVMQDGQHGGILAVDYLVSKGHRELAWFGPVHKDGHGLDRLSGYTAACRRAGIQVDVWETADDQALDMAMENLSAPGCPGARVALWASHARAVVEAATRIGRVVGKDIDVVGWSMEEALDDYGAGFSGGNVPPTLVWSARTMAEAALSRLAERRQTPHLAALRVKIPVRLIAEI